MAGNPNDLAHKRVLADLRTIYETSPPGIIAENTDDLSAMTFLLAGPPESPYEGGLFQVRVEVGTSYPFKAPKVKMLTDVFHPNISEGGSICIDILNDEWVPGMGLVHVLSSLIGLLRMPNFESPLNFRAMDIHDEDPQMFHKTAKAWTHYLAGGPAVDQDIHEKMEIAMAVLENKLKALKRLTRHHWNLAAALGQ